MKILISIVNHRNDDDIRDQLVSFKDQYEEIVSRGHELTIALTHNLPNHDISLNEKKFVTPIINKVPRSFGENHNKAFKLEDSDVFVVCNPDVLHLTGSLADLCEQSFQNGNLVSPYLVEKNGEPFSPGRKVPSITELFTRFYNLFIFSRANSSSGFDVFKPDWIPGVFMVMPSQIFRDLQGFDENIFMYYEDADLCRRLVLRGFSIATSEHMILFHKVGRGSKKSPRLFFYHALSALRVSFLRPWKKIS